MLLHTERMATPFIDVLRIFTTSKKFKVHEFVVMRNHFHVRAHCEGANTYDLAAPMIATTSVTSWVTMTITAVST